MKVRKHWTKELVISILIEKEGYDGFTKDGQCNLEDYKEDFKEDGRYDDLLEYVRKEHDFMTIQEVIDNEITNGFAYMYGDDIGLLKPYIDEIFEDENCINKLLSDFLISSGDGSVCDACVDYIKKMSMERKVSIVNKLL